MKITAEQIEAIVQRGSKNQRVGLLALLAAEKREEEQGRLDVCYWPLPFGVVCDVVSALTQLGEAVPESKEEQASRAVELVSRLAIAVKQAARA